MYVHLTTAVTLICFFDFQWGLLDELVSIWFRTPNYFTLHITNYCLLAGFTIYLGW